MNPVKAGDQIYVSYGADKTNQELLPAYGFIDVENEKNFASFLTLKLKKSDPLIDLKKKILGEKER